MLTSNNIECFLDSLNFLIEAKLFFFLIGIQLLYNAVLVSAVQQNESAIRIHIYPPCNRTRPCGPCSTCLQPPFCLWKTLAKE